MKTILITEIKEGNAMTTIELLKEVQRLELECMIHPIPVHITTTCMPEHNRLMNVTVQNIDHEVLVFEMISDDMSQSELILKYNQIMSVIGMYTAVRLAG